MPLSWHSGIPTLRLVPLPNTRHSETRYGARLNKMSPLLTWGYLVMVNKHLSKITVGVVFYKKIRGEGICLVEVQSGVGKRGASTGPTTQLIQYRMECIQGMGRGVERVVETEKGRERG